MLQGCGSAPGKVILLGEHAVVYGRTAIAASMDRHVSVRVGPVGSVALPGGVQLKELARADERLLLALEKSLEWYDLSLAEVDVSAATDLPVSVGLGSSAALSVALIRALADATGDEVETPELCRQAFELEKIFHGTPSGIDSTVCAMEGLIEFNTQDPPRRIPIGQPLPLVIALGRAPRATGKVVARVRSRWQIETPTYEAIFDEIHALAEQAVTLIEEGDLTALGGLMNLNHRLLQKLEVSTPELDAMVNLARKHGALGAKLTGGGGGGAVVCLGPQNHAELMEVFQREGWTAFPALVGAQENRDASDDRNRFEENPEPAL